MLDMDVSIIMPAYNAEKYIKKAIKGIMAQQFLGTYELLIADDCSSDSTREILKNYEAQYGDFFKVVYNLKNLGCSDNSIQLCQLAQGKYLAFCDSDDIWTDPNKLQWQFDFLEKNVDYGMVCSNANIIDEKDEVIRLAEVNTRTDDCKDIQFESLIRKHEDVYNSSIMMRRDLYYQMLKDCTWYIDNKCLFDTVWVYYCSYHSKVLLMHKPLISFRSLENSDSHSTDVNKRLMVDRRYYSMKVQFLLQNEIPINDQISILLDEYDYLRKNSWYLGEQSVRNSKAYKVGRNIIDPLKKICNFLKGNNS